MVAFIKRIAEEFLSTLPARGATARKHTVLHPPVISIHAPREGSDSRQRLCQRPNAHFYPRSPRGERLDGGSRETPSAVFLSTLPARGATHPGG